MLDHADAYCRGRAVSARACTSRSMSARMQSDRRLVEHVEHIHQAGAQGGGERDALGLAAAQRAQRAIERQVVQSPPCPDNPAGPAPARASSARWPLPIGELQVANKIESHRELSSRRFGDVLPADLRRQGLGPQPRAVARRAQFDSFASGSETRGGAFCTCVVPARRRSRAGRRTCAPARLRE